MAQHFPQGLVIGQCPALTKDGVATLVHRIIVTIPLTNTGNTAFGIGLPVLATHVNCIAEFTQRSAASDVDASTSPFVLDGDGDGNCMDPTQCYVAHAVAGEGLLVTYFVK